MDNQNKELTEQLNNVNTNLEKLKKYVIRLDNLLNHLSSIDESLKTMAWVESAQLSMNKENIKNLKDTNEVPEDVLVHDDKDGE